MTDRGFEGENRIDRVWSEIMVPFKPYLFHNYETENEVNYSQQIDTKFLCQTFILLVEIKNIGGQIDLTKRSTN